MANMRHLNYKILLRKEPEGCYTVFVPALEGCITYGETIEDAKRNAKEAVELYIESLIEDGEAVSSDLDFLEYQLELTI